jgi:hypothetical protein
MARINSALYNNDIIDAFEVDDNYDYYKRDMFKCPDCDVKIQFNRGINKNDPHFKNWPNIEHTGNCGIALHYNKFKVTDNENIDTIISTILPRSTRLKTINHANKKEIIIKRYFGNRSKKFLNALNSLNKNEIENLSLRTEDGITIKLMEMILRQDEIIERLENNDTHFICILKGYTTKVIEIKGNIKIPLTYNGNYGNKNKFDLFIPYSYKEKNKGLINNIENKLIYCYGFAEKNQYGSKMDIYSITHQIVIIK